MSGSDKPTATLADMQAWAHSIMDSRAPDFVIGGEADPYLLRWRVIPRNPWCNVYLHSLKRSDDDTLHDHPWDNRSVVIQGSYIEHMQGMGRSVVSFTRQAGDVIERSARTLHRLETVPGVETISLFITGPALREWGFMCGHGWVHWKDYTNERDSGVTGRGCGEPGNYAPVTPIGQKRVVDVQ